MQPGKEREIREVTEIIKDTVDCEKIYLFGSYAHGEPGRDSDLDFYVVIPDDAPRPIEVKRRIYKKIGKSPVRIPVDILAKHASAFAEMSALPTLEKQVAGEGVVLYERGGLGAQMA